MERRREAFEISPEQAAALLGAGEPGQDLSGCAALTGGLANSTYSLELASGEARVLRIVLGEPGRAATEARLLELLAGHPELPVPRVFAALPAGAVSGIPYPALLLDRLPGQNLATALPSLPAAHAADLGHQVGRALARIQAFEFERSGELVTAGQNLRVEPWRLASADPELSAGLAFGLACIDASPAGPRLGRLAEPLRAFLQEGARRWPELSSAARLVHGDFKPPNLLVRLEAERACLSGVLDWEFAHAGTPAADHGNLFRVRSPSLPQGFEAGVEAGLRAGGVALAADWRRQRSYVDVLSALEFLSSSRELPQRHAASLAQVERALGEDG